MPDEKSKRRVKFPVSFEKLLRLAYPKKRTEDRWKYYRMEIRETLLGRLYRAPTIDEIEEQIRKDQATIWDGESASRFIYQIGFHREIFEKKVLRERAEKGAAARWNKKS